VPLTQEETTTIAKGIVVALCGGRWVSPPVRFVDTYPMTATGRIVLSGRPVQQVHSVTVGDELLDPSQYRLYNGMVLDLNPGAGRRFPWCGRDPQVEVDYTYGVFELPPLVQSAVDKMASEITLAEAGSNQCRLPQRVTSVQRQGMSWTLIDPQDFLDDGRTGIYEVDMAIKATNPAGARRRARVFSVTQSAPALRRPV
jgi:hypothetical protein